MPKQVKPVLRRPRVPKPRRIDILPRKLNKLSLEAEEGRYRVDALAAELQACGWLVPGRSIYRSISKDSKPHQIIRDAINIVGAQTLQFVADKRAFPRNKEIAKTFLKNLRDLRKAIKLCAVDPEIMPLIVFKAGIDESHYDWPSQMHDEIVQDTEIIIEHLRKTTFYITDYLDLHRMPTYRGGNVAWWNTFIKSMADYGLRVMTGGQVPELKSSDVKLFSTLLEYGWMDLKFPLKNHYGESLEPLDLFFEDRLNWILKQHTVK